MRDLVIKGATFGMTAGAAMATRKVLEKVWRKRTGDDPPTSDLFGGEGFFKGLAWMVILGVAVAAARSAAEQTAQKVLPAPADRVEEDSPAIA